MLSKDSHSVNAMEAADEERGEEEGMFLFFLYQTLLLCVFLLTDVFSFFFFSCIVRCAVHRWTPKTATS